MEQSSRNWSAGCGESYLSGVGSAERKPTAAKQQGAALRLQVLALVGVTPERLAALTAAGYAVREGKQYTNQWC